MPELAARAQPRFFLRPSAQIQSDDSVDTLAVGPSVRYRADRTSVICLLLSTSPPTGATVANSGAQIAADVTATLIGSLR